MLAGTKAGRLNIIIIVIVDAELNEQWRYTSNVSSETITAAEWSSSVLGERNRVNGVIMAVALTIFLVIGAFLNLTVIVSIVKKKLFSQPTFLLLLNLSVTDFFFCATVMPFQVTGFAGEFVFGRSDLVRCRVCKVGVIITTLAFLSLHSVTLISVDRLLFIKKPLRYHKIVTIKRIVVVMVLTWCACIGISLPPLFGFGQIRYIQNFFHCALNLTTHNRYVILLVGEALVQLLALVISSLWVALIAQKHLKQIIYRIGDQQEIANHHQVVKKQKSKRQFHLIRVFGAIIIANILTWIPILAFAVVATIVEDKVDIPIEYVAFSYLCFLFQPVVHPLLEASLISEIEFPFLKSCWRLRKSRLHKEEMCRWRCGLGVGFNGLRVGCVDRECVCRVCGLLDACSVAALPRAEEEEVPGGL